jgi:hypothetical protein
MMPRNEALDERRAANRRERSLNWTLLLFYFFIVLRAMFGEAFTKFSLVTFGYYYIMLGMPAWIVCWFALLIINEISPFPKVLLRATILVTVLAVAGYMNINA